MSSVSTVHWMIVFLCASGTVWLKRPGKRLEPTEKSRSHLRRKWSAIEPRTPMERGWFSGKTPLALSVVSTGIWAASANCSSSAAASA